MKIPKTILDNWIKAVSDKDIEAITSLYDKEAVLIPTFSNILLNTPDKIKDYFIKLGSREGLKVILHDKTIAFHLIKETVYSICGIYCFQFSVEGEILSFEARFSFIIDASKEAPILQHHSSQIPRML